LNLRKRKGGDQRASKKKSPGSKVTHFGKSRCFHVGFSTGQSKEGKKVLF